ncbi:MAG TPA: hypothetical protein VKA32_03855 [Gammaproteobacteria bacterium]|nr:hypothetical protein [Gammaproteobacteria bacterium]
MRLLLACLLSVCGMASAEAAGVQQAYPATYELTTLGGDHEVLASGHVLLLPDKTVVAEQAGSAKPKAPKHGARVSLRFSLSREPGEGALPPKLILDSEIHIARVKGSTRVAVPDKPESFIQGAKVENLAFNTRSWRREGDPTPIVSDVGDDGDRYRLTVIFDSGA